MDVTPAATRMRVPPAGSAIAAVRARAVPLKRRARPGPGIALVAALMVAGCGLRGGDDPPAPGDTRGGVPDLHGQEVMVLPAQRLVGLTGGGPAPDQEIAFALEERAPDVEWVLPSELRATLEASPGFDLRIEGLDVAVFLQAEVDRVGDPLYGQIRRLSTLAGASLALIPVEVLHRPETDEDPPAVQVTATLLDPQTGRVVWFGVVEGSPGPPDDPAPMASAAEALAEAMGF